MPVKRKKQGKAPADAVSAFAEETEVRKVKHLVS